jgi:asparagine synthase (glutamine-hydrolysing)
MQAELRGMINALSHRGPDGQSCRVDGPVGLAHARLAVIDLAGGQQPIHNEDQTVWVILNGEIFNYLELRADLLALGHRFYTDTDTEVIVHLYEEYGDAFVSHLNGQFAIALHDRRKRRFLLVRDRVGIRPLFYTLCNQRLLFASEIKALFTIAGVRREIDFQALAETFKLWGVAAPASNFVGVTQLPPGSVLTLELDNTDCVPLISTYWRWNYDQAVWSDRSAHDLADELRALLQDSVRLQLRADVPVAAYLSGGLDSAAIVAMIREQRGGTLRSFSISFDDEAFNERSYQREAVDYFGCEHSEIHVTGRDISQAFAKTIWHVEAPLVRTAAAPLMLLAGHARDAGFKVVLSGEGADEVLAGYDLFKEAAIRRFIARAPASAWRGRLLQRLYPYLSHSPMRGTAMAQRYLEASGVAPDSPFFAHDSRIRASRQALLCLRPEIFESVAGGAPSPALLSRLPSGFNQWHALQRDQYVEATSLMSSYLLSAQGDRVAMANSIEARVPFLDHRLIEFANRLPPRLKLASLNEKYLLKKALQGRVPEAILRRTKQPYRAPDSASFFALGKPIEWVADLLSRENLLRASIFDPVPVAKLLNKCAAGRAIGFGENIAFVGVVSTMLLHAQFVTGSSAFPH